MNLRPVIGPITVHQPHYRRPCAGRDPAFLGVEEEMLEKYGFYREFPHQEFPVQQGNFNSKSTFLSVNFVKLAFNIYLPRLSQG